MLSVERSPIYINGVPNPKSDCIRLRSEGLEAHHTLRVGDWAPRIARLDHVGAWLESRSVLIVDNSGGSIAPVRPTLMIGINADPVEQFEPMETTSFCRLEMAREAPLLNNQYRIGLEVVPGPTSRLDPVGKAICYFVLSSLDIQMGERLYPQCNIVGLAQSEAELTSGKFPEDVGLITDDYLSDRYASKFRFVSRVKAQIIEFRCDAIDQLSMSSLARNDE